MNDFTEKAQGDGNEEIDSSMEHLRWYLATSKPRQEKRAMEQLANQGITACCPMISVEKVIRGKRQLVEEPLFTGYLFIQLDKESPYWGKIRSTRGMKDWVRFAGEVAQAPCAMVQVFVDASKSENQHQPVINLFKKGQSVQILSGPFAGLQGIFEKHDGEMRSMILIEFLGKQNRLKLDNSQISS
jgi:transcriptional antiterminator RfaH